MQSSKRTGTTGTGSGATVCWRANPFLRKKAGGRINMYSSSWSDEVVVVVVVVSVVVW